MLGDSFPLSVLASLMYRLAIPPAALVRFSCLTGTCDVGGLLRNIGSKVCCHGSELKWNVIRRYTHDMACRLVPLSSGACCWRLALGLTVLGLSAGATPSPKHLTLFLGHGRGF